MSDAPKMPAQSDSDARAMAALGGGPTDPNPTETAARAAASVTQETADDLTKAEGKEPPVKAGPSGQDKADGSQMTPGPVLNKGKKKKDDEDEDEKKDEKMEYSVSDDDLIKTLDDALETARGASPDPDPDRRAELADKLAKGENTPEELQELHGLIKSELPSEETDEDLDKSFTETALDDPDIQADIKTNVDGQEYDVSGFLARQNAFVGGALDSIRGDLVKSLTKGFGDASRFNLAMAKANRALGQRVLEQGDLVKSLTDRLSVVEETPVPHRALQGAAQLKKSLPQTDGNQNLPTRAQIINGLTHLNKSAGDDGKAPCGRDITEAVVRFESTGQIHPDMMANIKKAIGFNE